MTGVQRLQVTLHHPPHASSSQFHPLCSISNRYPFKPVLLIADAAHAGNNATGKFDATQPTLQIPLPVRVDMSSASMTQQTDATIITFKYTHDLAERVNETEEEDAFPTARELDSHEYSNIYCRACGTPVLAPSPAPVQPIPSESTLSSNLPCVSSSPPCRSAYKVCGLPSAHWRELTELWFCATTGNAHLDRLAAAEWGSVPGRILLDRMELRIHAGDLYEIQKMQWREQTSVKRLIARLNKQNQSASNASTATTPPTSTPASSLPSTSLWSPLPCAGCHAMLGSILLTVTPSSVEVASEMDVRLHKYALSNCFRTRQTQQTPSTSEVQQGMQTDTGHAKSTSASTVDTSTTMTSPDDLSHLLSAFASCLCSKYPNSSLLTCSNMFVCYSSENWIAEQLRQRHQASPINKFIITHPIDDDDEEHDAQDDGRDHSGVDRSDVGNDVEMKDGSSTVQRHKRLLIRVCKGW